VVQRAAGQGGQGVGVALGCGAQVPAAVVGVAQGGQGRGQHRAAFGVQHPGQVPHPLEGLVELDAAALVLVVAVPVGW